jgi:uncharacterized protein (TIRG00374 family)
MTCRIVNDRSWTGPTYYHGYLGEKIVGRKRKILLFAVTNLISFACLIFALRDVRWADLQDDLKTMNWWWVVIAVIADIAVYCWHGLRWSLLLQPLAPVSFGKTVQAVYVGLFTNEVLPLRVGELVRCYLIGRWSGLPFTVTLSTAVIERVFDGIWLSMCLFATLLYVPFPKEFRYVEGLGYFTAATALTLAALLALAIFNRDRALKMLAGDGWKRSVRVIIEDLHRIGHSRYLYFSFVQSLPYLLLSTIPIYAAMLGYGFDFSIGIAFAVMVVLRVGSVIPQAPGNIGVYQFLTLESLYKIFNVDKIEAARFALVLWGVVTLPLLVGGFIALLFTEASLGDLRRAARQEAQAARN